MNITLEHTNGVSDYGPSVEITEPWEYLSFVDSSGRYYLKSPEGVFRRSSSYWEHSPYGWSRVLPCHIDKWGMQSG